MVVAVGYCSLAAVAGVEVELSYLTVVVDLVVLLLAVVGYFVVDCSVVGVLENYCSGLLVCLGNKAGGSALACHIFGGIRG